MQTTKNVEYLHIGAATFGLSPDGDPRATSITGLAVGEIGIFTPEGVQVTEATAITSATARFVIATKLADGTIVRSPEYNKADIKSCTRKVYTAGTVQTDYVGYNGTTGSIDVINSNLYKIHIQVQELLRSNTDGRKVKFGVYKSSTTATQAEIASALTKSLFQNFEREAETFIKFYMLTNNAGAAITGTGTISVNNGSKTVLAGTDIDAVLAVGDYIRLGSTAVTGAVYKIVSINATAQTLELDMPYQGTTLVADAEASSEYISAANMATAACGIKMVGQALSFKAGKFNDEVAMWETQLVGFEDTTTNFKSTAATRGTGTVNQLKQMEWFTQGFEGEYMREPFSSTHTPRTNTNASVLGGGYDLIRMTFETKNTVGFQSNISHQAITLAIPTDASTALYAIAATTDDITDVLECLAFGSATGALAIT